MSESTLNDLLYTGSMTMAPMWQSTEISMSIEGINHYLRPKNDITAYELFNINKWLDEVKINQMAFKADKFYERAIELDIIRHFESDM